MKVNLKDPRYQFTYNQLSNPFDMALLDDELRAVHTPVMCKDYFQDIFWSEYTGNSGECCGLTWEKGRFPIKDRMNMALRAPNARSKVTGTQEFLNCFDDAQGIDRTAVAETEDDNIIIVNFSKAWSDAPALFSAFTSLLRLGGGYPGADIGSDPRAYLKSLARPMHDPKIYTRIWTPEPAYMIPDVSRMSPNLGKRLMALLEGKKITQTWAELKTMNAAHGYGICGARGLPEVEL